MLCSMQIGHRKSRSSAVNHGRPAQKGAAMLKDLVVYVAGIDPERNVLLAIPLQDEDTMTAALRAIAAYPPLHVIELQGSSLRMDCSPATVCGMVPHLDPVPKQIGDGTSAGSPGPVDHELIHKDAKAA